MHKLLLLLLLFFLSSIILLRAQTGVWQQLPGPYGGSVNCATQKDDVWYIGTGSGVFKSSDEGENWQRLDWTPQRQIVTSILFHDNKIVVATTEVDLSEYSTDNWLGLIHRSTDQGQNWEVDTIKPQSSYGPLNLKLTQQHDFLFAYAYLGIYRSADQGQTWEAVPGVGFNQNIQFNDSLIVTNPGFMQARYSKDGAQTWTNLPAPPANSSGGYFLGKGNTIFYLNRFDPSYRTTNFGASWQSIGMPFGYNEIGTCKLLPDGKIAALVSYFDTDEMLFVSGDNGSTWKKFNGSPVINAVDVVGNAGVYGLATAHGFYKNYPNGNFMNPANTGIAAADLSSILFHKGQFLAGASDGLWRSFDNGQNWFPSFPQGQLLNTREVQAKGDTLCALTNERFFFSTDEGDSWTDPYVSGGSPWGVPFDEPFHFAIDGDNVLVAGYDLYRSSDFAQNWYAIDEYPRCSGALIAEGNYFAIAYWDGVIRSSNQGQSWQVVNDVIFGEGRLYYLHEKIFACGERGILRSLNLGNSWSKPNGLPTHGQFNSPLPVHAMAASDNALYAAVDFAGIYTSTTGTSWSLLSSTMPNPRFKDLAYKDGALYAACAGGGIWKYELGNVGTQTPVVAEALRVWPNPLDGQELRLDCPDGLAGQSSLSVYDALGRVVFNQNYPCGNGRAVLSLPDLKPGIYRLVLASSEAVYVGSFVKI